MNNEIPDNVSVSSRASTLSSFTDTDSVYSDDSSVFSTKTITRTTTLGGEELVTVKKRRRKKKASKNRKLNYNPEEWNCVGHGELGIPELVESIPKKNDKVVFGALKIKVGSGKFQRCKTLFVHFNGINCGGLLRGKANGKLKDISRIIGDVHATYKCEDRSDFTIDNVFDQVGHLFVTDNIQGSGSVFKTEWTLEDVKRQYQKQIEEKREEFLKKVKAAPRRPVKKMSRVKEILSLVRSDFGWVNWCLFKPTEKKLKLAHEGAFGAGTIFAMRENLAADQVYFGLLRMSFGVTPYRRSHTVMIHWVGPKVNRIKRGKLSAKAAFMANLLLPYGVTIQLGNIEEVTVENIITRVRKIVNVDGHEDESPEIQDARLMEEFQKALAEEEERNKNAKKVLKADMSQDVITESAVAEAQTKVLKTNYTETCKLIHDPDEEINWLLLEPKFATRKISIKRRVSRKKTRG